MHEGMTVAGRYEVVRLLGRGGLAEVWESRDRQLRRAVAIKFVTGVARYPEAAARFSREAEVLAALRHPGVVTVFDAGVVRGEFGGELPYMVMELVAGRGWDEANVGSVTGTAAKVADALAHAHAARIAHRDVKPANIMITEGGDPILLDFGIARDDNALSVTVTATGHGFGTPRYMAPEQVAGHRGTAASDVYALGLVVLEKLTGSVDRGTLDLASTTLSAQAVGLLKRMTADLEADRPSAAESAAELRALEQTSPVIRQPGGSVGVSSPPSSVGSQLRRPGLVLLAVVSVAALALSGWGMWLLGGSGDKNHSEQGTGASSSVSGSPARCTPTSAKGADTLAPVPPSEFAVNVFNGTARAGLAGIVVTSLKDRGFTIGRSGNQPAGPPVSASALIIAGPAGRAQAMVVGSEIEGSQIQADTRSDTSVDLIVGDAFAGLRTPDQAAEARRLAFQDSSTPAGRC